MVQKNLSNANHFSKKLLKNKETTLKVKLSEPNAKVITFCQK